MAESQEDGITTLLGMEGLRVKGVREEGKGIVVEIKTGGEEASCPRCGAQAFYRHGKAKPRRALHSWSRGRRVYLSFEQRRWRCRGRGSSFTQGLNLLRPYSQLTRQAEEETLWELQEHSFSRVRERLGVGYGTLRRPLEREVEGEALGFIADANQRLDEARRLEQEVRGRKVSLPKRVFLVGRERPREEQRERVDRLLERYPNLKPFYWAKEKLRELYRQQDKGVATRWLDLGILNLRAGGAELVRWANTLRHWREPILNYWESQITNAFTEGCHTKIKLLKRVSYGLRSVEVYARKMLLGFLPAPISFPTI